jgi:hypothetical protein
MRPITILKPKYNLMGGESSKQKSPDQIDPIETKYESKTSPAEGEVCASPTTPSTSPIEIPNEEDSHLRASVGRSRSVTQHL